MYQSYSFPNSSFRDNVCIITSQKFTWYNDISITGCAVPQTDDTDIHVNPRIAACFTIVVSLKALAQATHKCLMVFIINISTAKVIVR